MGIKKSDFYSGGVHGVSSSVTAHTHTHTPVPAAHKPRQTGLNGGNQVTLVAM